MDIKDAFYHVGLPAELRHHFVLPRLRAGSLGLRHVEGRPVLSRSRVRPCLAVLPMGCAHALDFCQKAHRTITLEGAGLGDGRPPAAISKGAYTAYVDNFVAFGTGPDRATALLDSARKALE